MFPGSRSDDRFRANVQWFWRDFELRGLPRKIRPDLKDDRELFLNSQINLENEIDLGTVIGKCQVSGHFKMVGGPLIP